MIGFAGLSHLGIIYSLATAERGFEVIAFHPSAKLVADLSAGQFPVEEPGLAELFQTQRTRIHYTAEPRDLSDCALVFVSLDIKTDEADRSDTDPLNALIGQITPHLRVGSALVVLSQVNPGFTRQLHADLLGLGSRLEIYYQVETLIFGRAVERALHPERYMVGAADPQQPLPRLFRQWHERFSCPVLTMRYESAELAKIAINFFLVSSVATSNTLAELCGNIGADWSEITPALRLDARIGPKAYLTPGLGIAGGNLERDLITVKRLSDGSDADTGIVDAWLENSRHCKTWTSRTLRQALAHRGIMIAGATIAVWGLAYKENTHSTKNSPALAFLASIPECHKRAYDPAVPLGAYTDSLFERAATELACCDGADALVICTPWPVFRQANLHDVRARMKGDIVLDPLGLLDGAEARAQGFDYYRLGVPPLLASLSPI